MAHGAPTPSERAPPRGATKEDVAPQKSVASGSARRSAKDESRAEGMGRADTVKGKASVARDPDFGGPWEESSGWILGQRPHELKFLMAVLEPLVNTISQMVAVPVMCLGG